MNLRRYLQILIRHESAAIAAPFREQKLTFLLVGSIIVIGLMLLEPFPPREVNVASGRPTGNYAATVDRINTAFRAEGIKATNVHTQGSLDNARLLLAPDSTVNAALIQGGALRADEVTGLNSLGSVGYEPLWIFYDQRRVGRIDDFAELIRWRVGVGPTGGGTRPVLADALRLNNLSIDDHQHFISDSYDKNLADFEAGRLDVIVMVASIQDANIRRLFEMPHARVAQIRHAEA